MPSKTASSEWHKFIIQVHEPENVLLEVVEVGLEDLRKLGALVESVALERGEQIDDALGAGSTAEALLGVERKSVNACCRHAFAEFAFDEGVDEDGDEVQEQERLDARDALQPDGSEVLDALELLVPLFQAWLELVRLEDPCGREIAAV
ncbi:MAG: hypothetical protein HUU15_11255 [Candidatus Brocadiae bacterium]|nr:hypothetical protein [Candidatus Brocadiia bacterium]